MEALVESVYPLYVVGRVFGFLPFKILKNGGIKISNLGILHGVNIFAILTTILLLRLDHGEDYKLKGSYLSKLTLFCSIMFSIGFSVSVISVNFVQRKKFCESFECVWKFDWKVNGKN
jgi:hypothetical protein